MDPKPLCAQRIGACACTYRDAIVHACMQAPSGFCAQVLFELHLLVRSRTKSCQASSRAHTAVMVAKFSNVTGCPIPPPPPRALPEMNN